MDRYHTNVRLQLPLLLTAAIRKSPNVEFYDTPLKWWSCGLFFNVAVARVAIAFERTLSTTCEGHNHYMSLCKYAKCAIDLTPKNGDRPTEALRVLKVFVNIPGRLKIDQAVVSYVNSLLVSQDITEADVETIDKTFSISADTYLNAAITFIWRDANIQKHRNKMARGSVNSSDSTRDPRIQYALCLRSFFALCDVYSELRQRFSDA